jgi:inorganic pyrophosphatase
MRSWKQQQTESEGAEATENNASLPELEVTIEIPSGSFLKRGSTGQVDFVSPFPCPFNYGSVEKFIGLEGDLLDAVVLGPRLPRGSRVTIRAFGAVGLTDRGMYDDKLICSHHPVGRWQRSLVLLFFSFYARCKWLLNLVRGQAGRNACEGWGDPKAAIARAQPRSEEAWKGPSIPF